MSVHKIQLVVSPHKKKSLTIFMIVCLLKSEQWLNLTLFLYLPDCTCQFLIFFHVDTFITTEAGWSKYKLIEHPWPESEGQW